MGLDKNFQFYVVCDGGCGKTLYPRHHDGEPNREWCDGRKVAECCRAQKVGSKASTAKWFCMECAFNPAVMKNPSNQGWLAEDLEQLLQRSVPSVDDGAICERCQTWCKNWVQSKLPGIQRLMQHGESSIDDPDDPPAAPSGLTQQEPAVTKPEFDKMKEDMIDMKRRLSRVYVAQRPPTWTSIEIYKDQPQPAAGQDGARTFQIHSESSASDDFEKLNHQAGFQLGGASASS